MSDMSVTEVRNYLNEFNRADRVREFEASSATVELAAKALGVEEARIAKTLSFYGPDGSCIRFLLNLRATTGRSSASGTSISHRQRISCATGSLQSSFYAMRSSAAWSRILP